MRKSWKSIQQPCATKLAWWFQTCFFPFHIWDVILPIDFHSIIFQRGRAQPPTSCQSIERTWQISSAPLAKHRDFLEISKFRVYSFIYLVEYEETCFFHARVFSISHYLELSMWRFPIHGDTPSSHPLIVGIFHEIKQPASGIPHDVTGNPHDLHRSQRTKPSPRRWDHSQLATGGYNLV